MLVLYLMLFNLIISIASLLMISFEVPIVVNYGAKVSIVCDLLNFYIVYCRYLVDMYFCLQTHFFFFKFNK